MTFRWVAEMCVRAARLDIVRGLAVAAAVVTTAAANGAGERLVIHVSRSIAMAPADLSVRTTVASNKDNGSIVISADSAQFYRSSEIELDGDKAPRTIIFEFRSLPT